MTTNDWTVLIPAIVGLCELLLGIGVLNYLRKKTKQEDKK